MSAALALSTALLTPQAPVLLLSPSDRQSGELFRKVVDLYDALGRPLPAESRTARRLELANDSRVLSLPGTEKTLRGFSGVALLVIDEAARLVELFDREPLSGGTLVVDETGVGRPVVDLLRTLPIKASVHPFTITSGSRARLDPSGRWRVSKKLLIANVRRLLGTGRLKVADGLPEAAALIRELADFRVTITSKANETFAAGSHGGHDDLVLAVALAVWVATAGRPVEGCTGRFAQAVLAFAERMVAWLTRLGDGSPRGAWRGPAG